MNFLKNILTRAVVKLVNAANPRQRLQLSLLAGELKGGIEHVEPYGFTSHPKTGAEAVAAFFGGDRSHGVAIVVSDRRYRLQALAEGEVALHDDTGQRIVLKRDGIDVFTDKQITATCTTAIVNASASTTINSPSTLCTGALTVKGLITGQGGLTISGGSGATVDGSMVTTGDVVAGGISLQNHTHPGDSGGTTGPAQ